MRRYIICFYMLVFLALQTHGQVMGYPFPGDAQYPDGDGRRIDRIILETDRSFKHIVVDQINQFVFCASDNLNIPYVVRFDLNSFSKIDRLILDNGTSAITSAVIDPITNNIWFGTKGYCLVVDPVQFEIVRIVPVGNFQVIKIFFNPIDSKVLLLIKGDTDGLIEMDSTNGSYVFYPFSGFKNVFSDAIVTSNEATLVILAASSPSYVIQVDLNGYQVTSTTEIPGNYPVTAITLNDLRDELYVVTSGFPACLHRYDFPQMSLNGSIEFPFDERPRKFIFCNDEGTHIFVNDGDSSGGLIKIDAITFQREDRLDFGDLKYPVCFDRFQKTVLIATENTPGAILQVDPDMFTITRQYEFPDCETSAGVIFGVPILDAVCLAVKNSGITRLICFNQRTGQRSFGVDLPNVTGSVILSACDENNSIGYLVESGDMTWIVSVDLQKGELLDRKPLPENGEYKDLVFTEESSSLFLLTSDSIIEIDSTSLASIDSVALEAEIIPATTFALDQQRSSLLVGGGINCGKISQYSVSPLAFIDAVELDDGERRAVLLEADATAAEIYVVAEATPYKIKRFDTIAWAFKATLDLPFNGKNLVGLQIISSLDQALFFEEGKTTKIHRLDRCADAWIPPTALQPDEFYVDCHVVESEPYAYISLAGLCPSIARYGVTQAHAIHGSWASLDEDASIEALNFFSHEAGNQVRLALYDRSGVLLWESALLENMVEHDWLKVLVSDGSPSELILDSGEYLLAFQVTGNSNSPSATVSSPGCSIRSAWPFGAFPSALVTWDETDVLWSIFADYGPVPPSPTPTGTPTPPITDTPTPTQSPTPASTPTADFTPTNTPTQKPQHTPTPTTPPTNTTTPTSLPSNTQIPTTQPTETPVQTPTPMPTKTPEPTATRRPGSGVDLTLSQKLFFPGDPFGLRVRLENTEPRPLNIELYVILDVYGNYWFGPGWLETVDAYKIPGFLGTMSKIIFDFIWPEVDSAAQNIVFWAGMVETGTTSIIGYYDRVEFAYAPKEKTPTPNPTSTPTDPNTPTQAPTQTPTSPPDDIRYMFVTDDPMTYPGENCQEPDTYCFAPERMYFCSEWQPVVLMENIGASPVNISINLEGNNPDDFHAEHQNYHINPGEIKPINIRFCPHSPPDCLKTADIIMEWNNGSLMIRVKGWCVAG